MAIGETEVFVPNIKTATDLYDKWFPPSGRIRWDDIPCNLKEQSDWYTYDGGCEYARRRYGDGMYSKCSTPSMRGLDHCWQHRDKSVVDFPGRTDLYAHEVPDGYRYPVLPDLPNDRHDCEQDKGYLTEYGCKVCGVRLLTRYGFHGGHNRLYCCDVCRLSYQRSIRGSISKERRRKIFERYGWRCHICNLLMPPYMTGELWTMGERESGWFPNIDHIVPVERGGTNSDDNLRPCHRHCNSVKGTSLYCRIVFRVEDDKVREYVYRGEYKITEQDISEGWGYTYWRTLTIDEVRARNRVATLWEMKRASRRVMGVRRD